MSLGDLFGKNAKKISARVVVTLSDGSELEFPFKKFTFKTTYPCDGKPAELIDLRDFDEYQKNCTSILIAEL